MELRAELFIEMAAELLQRCLLEGLEALARVPDCEELGGADHILDLFGEYLAVLQTALIGRALQVHEHPARLIPPHRRQRLVSHLNPPP